MPKLSTEAILIRIFYLIIACLAVTTCGQKPTQFEQISHLGELKAGIFLSPSRFYFDGSDYINIDQQHLIDFAGHLDLDIQIITADSYEALHELLANNEVDIITGNISNLGQYENELSYSPPSHTISHILVGNRSISPEKLTDENLNIVVSRGSIAENLINQQLELRTKASVIDSSNPYFLLNLIEDQIADFVILPKETFEILRFSFPSVKTFLEFENLSPISWAMSNSDSSLFDKVSEFYLDYHFEASDRNLSLDIAALESFNFFDLRAFKRDFENLLPSYLDAFIQAENIYNFDWELLAAIAYQESKWNQDAVSFTGVRGLMMLTQDTADFVSVNDINDPTDQILGGARYLRELDAKLPERIQGSDRLWLTIASYNLGFGHLEDARILTEIRGGNPDVWSDVESNLSRLEDEYWIAYLKRGYARGNEASDYVKNVRRYYELLKLMSFNEYFASN